jgi:hypothetical protein
VKITWTPPGGPAQEWEFDPSRLMVAELDAIEKVTGLSGLTAFGEALNAGSASALRSLLWVVRKRQDPALRYEAVDFALADLAITDDEAPPKDGEEEVSASAATT